MKIIKGLLLFILILVILYSSMWALKASYDTFPTVHSTLDTIVRYM
jgi:hypothetical protein